MCRESANTLYIREERKDREKVVLDYVDAGSVKENAGEARGEDLETLKRLRVRAHEREERVKINVELIATQVHLVLYIRCTINIAYLK